MYLTEKDVYKHIKDFCAVKANKIILTRSILSTNSDMKSYFTFVPALDLCFHIVDIEEFKKQFHPDLDVMGEPIIDEWEELLED